MIRVLLLLGFILLLTSCRQHIPAPPRTPSTSEHADLITTPPGIAGGRMIDSSPGEPSTLNPLVTEDATSSGVIDLLHAGLISWNPVTDQAVPWLAERWEIDSTSKVFTFYLRKDLYFSDGTPLTADDVKFTFDCYYDKRFSTRKAYDLSVDGKPFTVQVVDPLTVRISTPEIFAPMLQYIGGAEILPRHILNKAKEEGTLMKQWTIATAQQSPRSIVGAGPFVIHTFLPGERMVLSPNPHYFRKDSANTRLPYVDFYIIKFVKDQNASMAAFAAGLTDSEAVTPDNVAWIRRGEVAHDYTIHDRGPSTTSTFLWLNQNPGRNSDGKPYVAPHKLKWFQDARFRTAISTAINRDGIVQGVLFGRGTPAWGPESPANRKWYFPNIQQTPYNPKLAEEMLDAMGLIRGKEGIRHDSEGNPVSFVLITNQENQLRQNMATIIKENLRAIGIDMKLQFLDFNTFVKNIQDSFDYEAGLLGLTGGGDPAGGMSVYVSKGRMHQWHPNQVTPATPWEAKIDQLMIEQLKTLDHAKRYRLYSEVQKIMSEQLPFIYLIHPNAYVGLKNKWRNINMPPTGSPLWNIDSVWTP